MPAARRILLVAAFDEAESPQAFPHAALQRRAFERLGSPVAALDLRPPARGLLGRLRGPVTLADRLARALRETAPDLVLVSGGGVDESTLRALRRAGGPRWALWCDGAAGAAGAAAGSGEAGGFDAAFATATDAAAQLKGAGAALTGFLPHAADPSVHRPVPSEIRFRANVVFVGRATPRRAELLAGLAVFGLALWGPGWRTTALRDYCRGERLTMADAVRACAGASVAVNIHRPEPDGRPGWGCNRRVFELAAIGVPQVVDARHDLPRLFAEHDELLVYRTGEELRDAVRDALGDPVRAARVAQAARRRALAEHTYMHRCGELLTRVFGD